MQDEFNGPREIEHKGYTIGYAGRFNLVKIKGHEGNFTSFAQAVKYIDNPANAETFSPKAAAVKAIKERSEKSSPKAA